MRDDTKFDRRAYLKPIWTPGVVYHETVLYVGETDAAPLLYQPTKILSVRNYELNVEYKEGVDYAVDGKKIKRLPGSSMPFFAFDEYYRKTPDSIEVRVNADILPDHAGENRYLKYGEGDTFTNRQIAVTYLHGDTWKGIRMDGRPQKLSDALRKIKAGNARIEFFGDSITVGCNASGTIYGGNKPPYCESWPEMVVRYLQDKYHVDLEVSNTAIGGTTTRQGVDRFEKDVLSYAPDLLIIGYGMNDPGTSLEEYKGMIGQMIERYRQKVDNGNVILISPMLPNVETNWCVLQPQFEKVLEELIQENDFCALAPMTSLHREILKQGKRYRDMTGNNVNHPNDFIVRVYAQAVLTALLGDEFAEDFASED